MLYYVLQENTQISAKVPSISELKQICRPKNRKGSWFGRLVARPISIHITRILLFTPITANQVTFLMLIAGIMAGTLFIFNNYWMSLAGGLLLVLAVILDAVDGEIARYRKTASLRGQYLDRISHILISPYMFVGISFGAYFETHSTVLFIFGFSASVFTLLRVLSELEQSLILVKAPQITKEEGILSQIEKRPNGKGQGIVNRIASLSRKLPDPAYDDNFIIVAVLAGAVFDRLDLLLIIYGIILPVRWLLQTVFDYKFHF